MSYSKELQFLKKIAQPDEQNERKVISSEWRHELTKEHPNVPVDYLDYLSEIGSGAFREGEFEVFNYLPTLDNLGHSHYDVKEHLCFFGVDDFGDFSGFNVDNNYSVVEFYHANGKIHETGQSFREYIREQMGMDENGNDLFE